MKSRIAENILRHTSEETKIFTKKYADLVIRINDILRRKGITQSKLANMMKKQPSEIHKWLSGDHNFTLKSLARLEAELGEELFEIPPKSLRPIFHDGPEYSVRTFVVYKNSAKESATISTNWNLITESKVLSNVS